LQNLQSRPLVDINTTLRLNQINS